MAEHPLCVVCGGIATELDHIKPHRGDLQLFHNRANWQALCKTCHGRKTAAGE